MALYYDNDGYTCPPVPGEEHQAYNAPYYSEIEANTVENLGVSQNWSDEGAKSLTMWFQGHPISDGSSDFSLWPEFSVTGRGRDIWSTHDEFYFLAMYPWIPPATTTFIRTRVVRMDDTNPWAKAGLMIREKWTPYSRFAAVYVTPGQGVSFQWREVEGGICDQRAETTNPNWDRALGTPVHLKLERSATGAFTASYSNTGETWDWADVNVSEDPDVTYKVVPMDDPCLYAGVAVTSHDGAQLCVADFNNFDSYPGTDKPWARGDIGLNAPEQLYVALSDDTDTYVVEHNDVNAATLTTWQEWNIKLSDFGALDLNAVKKVRIGLGDRVTHPDSGGSGAIYIDDIRACPPRCVASIVKPLYDIAEPYDCIVDEKDLALVGADWLLRDRVITTSAPSDVNLAAWYQFEGNFNDSSVHGYHASDPCGSNPGFAAGVIGQALSLDGIDDHLVVEPNVGIDGNTPRTIACWAKADHMNIPDWTLIFGTEAGEGGCGSHFNIGSLGGPGGVGAHVWGWEET
ncbi:MAG: hypothetical protein KAY24_17505, partial [Candidatus Eisenbacteria sp.]|nr:hypothetical protein [Candidatus Eisenbacteria bacterium]